MNNTSSFSFLSALVAVIIAIGADFGISSLTHPAGPDAGSTANSSHTAGYYDAGVGFRVNGTTIVSSARAATFTSVLANYQSISGSAVNSTSTGASLALTDTDLSAYSMVSEGLTVGSVTVTLPASSTLSSFITTTAGSERQIVIANATTTNGPLVTLAAGTGTFLTAASTTKAIIFNHAAFLRCVRMASSDISCALTGN